VLIDGFDVSQYPLPQLRRAVGIISQENKLMSGTILENIAIGEQFPNVEQAVKCARLANAERFILSQPFGFDQTLFEDGAGLSGGQKQRLNIARALYPNPKILIMDEATANLDNESENAIASAMPEIMRDKTVIMIVHRLNWIRNFDRIFVLDEGQIIEEGNHDDLVRKKGLYYQLVRNSV
jgi:ABC-type bacteriocin/lantibiotic exporter with double-glycine peptidase domain